MTNSHHDTARRLIHEASQHHQAGRLQAAETLYKRILADAPTHVDAANLLGLLCIQTGRPELALTYIRKAITLHPGSAQGYFYLGTALRKLNRTEEAISSYQQAINIAPSNAAAHLNLAIILEETGRLDEAAAHYRQTLASNPDSAQAYFHLARLRNHASSDGEIDTMKSLYSRPELSSSQRIWLAYGLGYALEKHGRYEEAFDFFQAGHRFSEHAMQFDLAQQSRFFSALMNVFDEDTHTRNRNAGPDDDLPIFIIGMPRSGTSLTEQILASHPLVQGAGELSYIEDTVRHLNSRTGKPFLVSWPEMGQREIHELGMLYLEQLRRHSDGCRHVTDTTPMNFVHAGLIATILPNARVVHCTRNPMDTCLSIFQQPLSESHAYAHDLTDLGGFYRLYAGLMAHWHTVLPGRIYNLSYERLVTDSETEIRKLLDYCKLPFHENCLAAHKTRRSVRTPSTSQVRQPIYTDSLERWRHYESRLEPLKAILG